MPLLPSLVRHAFAGRTPSSARSGAAMPRLDVVLGICGIAAVLALLLAACGGDSEEPPVFGSGTLVIETQTDVVELDVEVAETAEARQLGLTGRASLPEDTGMLFVHDEPVASAFTMRNTLIPLSIAFMDGDGRILRVLDMQPCEAEPCPAYDPELRWTTALEVNQGAFERLGVEVGDMTRLGQS